MLLFCCEWVVPCSAVWPAAVTLASYWCNLTLDLSLIPSLFSPWDHSLPSLDCNRMSLCNSFFLIFSSSDINPALEHLFHPAPLALILISCHSPGSPFRDEITLAILQLQENNRLEILKRRWWEGGQCPKEEDHRAKGQWTAAVCGFSLLLSNVPSNSFLTFCYSPANGWCQT